MPSRIIREGILTSPRVNALSSGAELFYRRLLSVADDYGRYHGHPTLLRAATFPLKMDVVNDDHIAKWLAETVKQRLIRVYEAEGQKCVEILDFGQKARSKSKFPAPREQDENTLPATCPQGDDKVNHLGVVEGVVEGVVNTNVDSGESTPVPEKPPKPTKYTDDFEAFWKQYPNAPTKGGKIAAFKAWKKLTKADRARAHEAAEVFAEAWERATKGQEYVMNASKWLNQGCWDDDLQTLAAQWADKYGVYA